MEGALAGGGDPATSPLYVFGPFLKLLVVAGVANVTFGASIWLVILTVAVVSGMYRLVMLWVVDGSGGSGLNEEEFGGWAVKLNAAITFIEFTLTFLVSMAALVTFLADRIPQIGESFLGVPCRTLVALALSWVTGLLVNRGPRMAARTFGPATAGVLVLLWLMIAATIWQRGLHLPALHWQAFQGRYLHFTLAGYTRLLALMTGIEIFANLVAAYEGDARQKSRKAFSSLLIIMGTTSLTMLIVGPAIHALADPNEAARSVFTQTMDALLPSPLAYFGTLVSICVLLSACAASAQGLQNLSLGLRYRHYVPAAFGRRNRYDVADKPVWLEVLCVSVCFVLFGTREETYLSLYAAGVFVLLSLTGWAACKRLLRQLRQQLQAFTALALVGTFIAAVLTTGATALIGAERFFQGAWLYCLLVPILYAIFTGYRSRLGPPTPVEHRLGSVYASQRVVWQATREGRVEQLLIPLDGSLGAEQALPVAKLLARTFGGRLTLVGCTPLGEALEGLQGYLDALSSQLNQDGLETQLVNCQASGGLAQLARKSQCDLLVWGSDVTPKLARADYLGMVEAVAHGLQVPILCVKDGSNWRERFTHFSTILVGLDGSQLAEQALPMACTLARRFESRLILVSVPEGSESEKFPSRLRQYLDALVKSLVEEGINVESQISGSGPSRTLLDLAHDSKADLIALTSHGRGGLEGARRTSLGSVTAELLKEGPCPVLVIPAHSTESGEPPTPAASDQPSEDALDHRTPASGGPEFSPAPESPAAN